MKISNFFKILNRKIEKYNKIATNPFTTPQPVILIWIEDSGTENEGSPDENLPSPTALLPEDTRKED